MLNPIVSCTVYAFEMLIAYIFFSRIADRRISSVKALLIGFALFELGSVLNLVFQNNVWVNTTVSILATFLFTLWCFEIKPLSAVAYALILAALNFALELVTVLVLSTLIKAEALALRDNLALLIVNCSASKILYFLTCLILSGIVKPKSNHAKVPSNLLFYPVSVTVCLGIFWYICVQDGITYEIQLLLALSSIICFGSTILLFIIYKSA